MDKLIAVTRSALTAEESTVRNIQQRNLASDSLRLLGQHEAALVKGYSMALLEIFAEGPPAAAGKSRSADASPLDFGELSLMDESEMQSQVELARAQQLASHATEAILAELNTLVSSAQGLRSVQPERNPLRPESYIRALQQVVGETGVNAEVRGLWMQHMRDLLGKLLVDEYKTMVKTLRDNGVEPVGYAVLGAPGAGARTGAACRVVAVATPAMAAATRARAMAALWAAPVATATPAMATRAMAAAWAAANTTTGVATRTTIGAARPRCPRP